jgi:hypothetical protein
LPCDPISAQIFVVADDDPEVDALFELPAGEFVAARDRLAAERRKAGDRSAADAVRQLRRPTVVAWILNQLARQHPEDVADLLALGRSAAAAQQQALAGDPSGLRDVDRRRRAAVGALVDAARELAGGSRTQLDEVEASLQAASLDPDGAGERWRTGRLEAAIPPASGFDAALGGWGLTAPVARPAARTPASKAAGGVKAARPSLEERQAEAEQVRARRRARDEARRTAAERSRAAQRADAAVTRLEEKLDELRVQLEEAREHAAEARSAAEEAQQALDHLDDDP